MLAQEANKQTSLKNLEYFKVCHQFLQGRAEDRESHSQTVTQWKLWRFSSSYMEPAWEMSFTKAFLSPAAANVDAGGTVGTASPADRGC